jgi:hypothetical protein
MSEGSVCDGRWIDTVEIDGAVGDLEDLLAWSPWRSSGRRSRGEAEVIEDPPCGMLILDEGDQAHGAGARRAPENVDGEGALEEPGPIEPARAVGVVGTVELVDERWASSRHFGPRNDRD